MIHSRWRYLGLIVLLGVYFIQAVSAAPYHSVTFDEQYYLTPGYVYLTQHDLRFHHDQNPPLFEAILATPLLARSDIHLPRDHPACQIASRQRVESIVCCREQLKSSRNEQHVTSHA